LKIKDPEIYQIKMELMARQRSMLKEGY